MKKITGFCQKVITTLFVTSFLAGANLHADWTTFSLPPLSQSFGSYWMGHMADGRLVYGSSNAIARESVFGSGALVPYSNAGSWDPSSVSLLSDNLGVVGQGTFGPSSLYLFNPSNLATGFTAITGVSIQNYNVVFRDSTSLYVDGLNGSGTNAFSLPKNALSYVKTDGSVNKVIIDNISDFSGSFAVDLQGNLYISNNDTGGLYKFTLAQLNGAIAGSPLGIGDGQFLTTLPHDSSIVIDALGRIISAGPGANGIDIYNPADNSHTTVVPGLVNSNYVVSTFSDGVDNYIAYIDASGSSTGASLTYGYDKVANVVPEPGSALLLGLGCGALVIRRHRRA